MKKNYIAETVTQQWRHKFQASISYDLWLNILEVKNYTDSAVIKREGGTKSNFSRFLIFFKATKPLSPTSTFCMAIFCCGSPESDSHFWRAEAFSNESMSHPHGIVFWVTVVLASFVVETEQWITWCAHLLRGAVVKKVWDCGLWRWENVGRSVVWKLLEASAMALGGGKREKPYPLENEKRICERYEV